MANPIGISHYGICVHDLDKSLEFYRDIVGMHASEVVEQDMHAQFGERQAQVYQKRRQNRRVAHLTWGDEATTPYMVLSSHTEPPVEGQATKLDQVGIHHLCFTVSDPTAMAKRLVARGVKLAGSLESYTNAEGKVRAFYAFDPDGILVQFSGADVAE